MTAPDPLFESAWLKWAWAGAEAKALQAEIQAYLAKIKVNGSAPLYVEYDPKLHGFRIRLGWIDPPPVPWAIMIGDVVSNFCSALDQLAWALVCRGETPPDTLSDDAQRRIYYPHATSPGHFRNIVGGKLPGVHPADLAIVRASQSYTRGKRKAATHPLPVLFRLRNDDSHRELQLSWFWMYGTDLTVSAIRDCIIRRLRVMPLQAVRVDTEIARAYVKKTGPNPDIQPDGQLRFAVTFADGLPVKTFTELTTRYVAGVLRKFSKPPDFDQIGPHGWNGNT